MSSESAANSINLTTDSVQFNWTHDPFGPARGGVVPNRLGVLPGGSVQGTATGSIPVQGTPLRGDVVDRAYRLLTLASATPDRRIAVPACRPIAQALYHVVVNEAALELLVSSGWLRPATCSIEHLRGYELTDAGARMLSRLTG